MDEAARVRLQIRAVITVYRAEMSRLKAWQPSGDGPDSVAERRREIVTNARANGRVAFGDGRHTKARRAVRNVRGAA